MMFGYKKLYACNINLSHNYTTLCFETTFEIKIIHQYSD